MAIQERTKFMGINAKYLDRESILFLDCSERDTVIDQMIDHAASRGHIVDHELFYRGIYNREQVVSTGIGMGVALPHAKLQSVDHFFIIVAILKRGVDWQALDGAPVRIVFMIGGPDDKQTQYLQVLSSITEVIKDEDRRKKLLTARSPEAIMALLSEEES